MKIDRSLLYRYTQQQCNKEEGALVESWLDELGHVNPTIDELEMLDRLDSLDSKIEDLLKERRMSTIKKVAIVASIILPVILFSTYYVNYSSNRQAIAELQRIQAPEGINSVIVMEDNQEVDLDSLAAGDTLHLAGYSILKTSAGEVQYIYADAVEAQIYNRLRTNKGGISSVQLADGTRVWLNAGSELRYPIKFNADYREVELVGEGYFEVAKLEQQGQRIPFYVKNSKKIISVLGTKFNANFYDDPEIALLEGSIALADPKATVSSSLLQFSEKMIAQEVFSEGSVKTSADIVRYRDWKDGYFNLNEVQLSKLVKRMEEWYNVPIKLDQELGSELLIGRISRAKGLKEVLDLIALALPIQYEYKSGTVFLKIDHSDKG